MSIADEIREACDRFDRVLARQLAEGLAKEIRASGAPYSADLALDALQPLRRKRYFDIALDLAEAVLESGQNDPLPRIFYVQALIDTGRVAAAIPYLESIIAATPADSEARVEAEGLIGRAYKQLYVNGGGSPEQRRDYLARACKAYYDIFAANNDEWWPGINAVALFHQAKDLPLPNPRAIAQRIFDDVRAGIELGKLGGWAYATAGEAALALGDLETARRWYEEYAAARVDAFEIASTLRQLVQVWKLTDTESPGREILPLLRAALLQREGGAVKVTPEAVRARLGAADDGMEKSFGVYGTETVHWFETGLDRCKGVCRIEYTDDTPVGTGFVVRGGDFHESLGDELLVLTNHHVVNDDTPGALRAGDAQARFEALSAGRTFRFHAKLVWSSRELDATLLRFTKTRPEIEPFPLTGERPTRAKDQPPPLPRVYLIGHPLGGGLSLSLVNNELVASDETRLHYRAPTERGSSGSPVFNEKWFVVGLHHRGDDEIPNLFGGPPYPGNEAYWIGAVRALCGQSAVTPSPRPRSSRPSTPAKKSSRRRT